MVFENLSRLDFPFVFFTTPAVMNTTRFLGGNRQDLKLEMAAAYAKIGSVQAGDSGGNLGDPSGALDSFLRAYSLLEDTLRRHPDDPALLESLGDTCWALSSVYETMGQEPQRIEASRRAAEIAWTLTQRQPEDPRLKAVALYRTANNLNSVSDWPAAIPVWKQAIAQWRTVLDRRPDWKSG
jgi:hypothetical protein